MEDKGNEFKEYFNNIKNENEIWKEYLLNTEEEIIKNVPNFVLIGYIQNITDVIEIALNHIHNLEN